MTIITARAGTPYSAINSYYYKYRAAFRGFYTPDVRRRMHLRVHNTDRFIDDFRFITRLYPETETIFVTFFLRAFYTRFNV